MDESYGEKTSFVFFRLKGTETAFWKLVSYEVMKIWRYEFKFLFDLDDVYGS